jgi:E3 ubiquitin-protein ligase HECTD1
MDDVGQTLLNWASAFGTQEMVEYLCEKGADVNKGQRSSSLHYAACFGRPAIAKVLLKHGANPDLRVCALSIIVSTLTCQFANCNKKLVLS